MRTIELTTQFKKDFEREKKGRYRSTGDRSQGGDQPPR